ncbi:serine/threonine-protein kinase [Solwaraspora sp. WMMD1047]|uniref:protein kinase domain-containing protein n=1 Tax=Solwaraspora sp. WMMD1047 TaxID=3016102 RepID=UPI0024160EDB|nr:serine/threonine-protein kinase [Solwaraspora sp. WMMD1047]MDG4828567.1 serine/threonine-protein kinase [Solwaraspora sp. WMMD1047]
MRQTLVAGRYRLLRMVGSGGMGQVWLARDELLHRDVAVKEILPPGWLAESEREHLRDRTMREARTAARLTHPNVVRIYDVVTDGGSPWIVMEYVPSRSLHDVIESDGPMPPRRVAELGLALLDALRAAHGAGVLHRDVKPHNVLIADDGRVMLTDFGLATFDGDGGLTRPGMVLGSPQYVAPERVADGISTPEGDLWSLGASLYAAVEGRSPYARSNPVATLAALATAPPDPAPNAGPLAPLLAGLLRRDPGHRLTSAEADRMLRSVLEAHRSTALAGRADGPASTGEPAGSADSAGPAGSVPGGEASAPVSVKSDDSGSLGGRRPARGYLLPVGVAVLLVVTLGLTLAAAQGVLPGDGEPSAGTTVQTEPSGRVPPPRPPGAPDGRPGGPPGHGGPPPVGPPPFGCRPPPPPIGRVVAATVEPPDGPTLLPDWTWHTDPAGFRVAAPVGWEYFTGNDVLCFHEPFGPRVLIVDPSPPARDAEAYWAVRERDLLGDDRVTNYIPIGSRPLDRYAGTEWEFRWTGPEGQPLHTAELLFPVSPERAFVVVWHTPEFDWRTNLPFLTLIRDSFQPVG